MITLHIVELDKLDLGIYSYPQSNNNSSVLGFCRSLSASYRVCLY